MVDPVAFTIFGHAFRWYGLCAAAGFLLACINLNALDRHARFPAGFGNEFGFVVMACGIIGSRLAHVIGEWPAYAAHPMQILRFDAGGMTYYGGFILGLAGAALLGRARKISALALCDYGVPALAIGHGLGRIGCLLNGCCYGRETGGPLGVIVEGIHRLPVQLFEAIFCLSLCAFLNFFFIRRRKFHGQVLALYMLLYGAWRFCIEFLREDSRVFVAGMSSAQWTSIALIATGTAIWFSKKLSNAKAPMTNDQ